MLSFEYEVTELAGVRDEDKRVLNAFGNAGWELVAITRTVSPEPPKLNFLAYFKKARDG